MTELLFREDGYLRRCDARVVAADGRGIRLDRTVFYPSGGGQPGDSGVLRLASGETIAIVDTLKGEAPDEVVHVPAPGSVAARARQRGRCRDRLGAPPPADAHAHLPASAVQPSCPARSPAARSPTAAAGSISMCRERASTRRRSTARLNALIADGHPVRAALDRR